jgi:hypothetical protein
MPFKTTQGGAESLRRRNARVARFHAQSAALMNDTKWREVLVLASRLNLWYLAAFVAEKKLDVPPEFERRHLRTPLPEVAFEPHQIGDWDGMCGPYKDLHWVLYPRRYFFLDAAGRKIWHEQKLETFLDQLVPLGRLPLEITSSFVRVYGYKASGN